MAPARRDFDAHAAYFEEAALVEGGLGRKAHLITKSTRLTRMDAHLEMTAALTNHLTLVQTQAERVQRTRIR
ncbi:hypothetical protein A7X88_13015 [Stenotrophomonas maltophilia]|nr:hypothetical protein C7E14_04685 [Stenotrophomonas maltophilia]PSD32079.1 hypothetical protein C7E12_00975 [Stenotrophomonas maltophilia]PZT25082.1 hypothetical protein A7X88_13015 [Stenotrophomonas maltophilia]